MVGENEMQYSAGEAAERTWGAIQMHKDEVLKRVHIKDRQKDVAVVRDDSPRVEQDNVAVVSSQWEPGLVLHAVPMTEVGKYLLRINQKQKIHVIQSEEGASNIGGNSSGPIAGNSDVQGVGEAQNPTPAPVSPHGFGEWNSKEAKEFGERLCEKTATTVIGLKLKRMMELLKNWL